MLPSLSAELDWGWAPLGEAQDIRVAPLLLVGTLPGLESSGYLGEELQDGEAELRLYRDAQLSQVPGAFALALPGQLARAMPSEWNGRFRDQPLSPRMRALLVSGVDGRRSLDQTMREAASKASGEAVLFHWMTDVQAHPLLSSHAPGTTTRAADRLVFIERDPVLAEATVGLALVSTGGEVLLRYEDRFQVLLSEANRPPRAGRELARYLVDALRPVLQGDALASMDN